MELIGLPQEILYMVIYHLDSHADIYALSRTCRTLCSSCATTKLHFHPNFRSTIYTLPRDHRFITNIVTQLADWAVESQSHGDKLRKAISDGLDGLLILATEVAWVTLAEIRAAACAKDEMHELFLKIDEYEAAEGRPTIINGAGVRFGLSNPYDRALGYLIYCALFHHEVDARLKYGAVQEDTPHLSGHLRLKYIEHCMPQKASWPVGSNNRVPPVHFDWHTCTESHLALYGQYLTLLKFFYTDETVVEDSAVSYRPAPSNERKKQIFMDVCLHLGWPSLCMLLPSGFEPYEEKLQAIKHQVMETKYEARRPQLRMGLDCRWLGFQEDVLGGGPLGRELADDVFGRLTFFR